MNCYQCIWDSVNKKHLKKLFKDANKKTKTTKPVKEGGEEYKN